MRERERTAAHGRVSRAGVTAGVLALGVTAALAGGGVAMAAPGPGVITTIAGGPGGPALGTKVSMSFGEGASGPDCGVSASGGLTYVGDSTAVRTLNPQSGWLENVAGTGAAEPVANDVPAIHANLQGVCSTVKDKAGNLLMSDSGGNTVRVVAARTGTYYGRAMTAGNIYTIAGTGTAGYLGDGGPAVSAELYYPGDVVLDRWGNVVIADAGNGRIRVVAEKADTFYGQAMTAGNIYTVAGGGTRTYFRTPATLADIYDPSGVAVDGQGNLVIADGHLRVDVVARIAGTFYGQRMGAGRIYSIAGDGGAGYAGDGGPATAAEFDDTSNVALDSVGNVLITDHYNDRIRVVAEGNGTFYGQAMTAGDVYLIAGDGHQAFAGDGGPATAAKLYYPSAAAVDNDGNVVIADTGNDRVRVVAEGNGTFYGQAMTAGDIYTVAGMVRPGVDTYPDPPPGYSGDGGPALRAQFSSPEGIAAGPDGSTLIADTYNERVRMVAGATGMFYGQAMKAGDVYTVAGTGAGGYNGNGGLATKTEIAFVLGIVADSAGNLILADYQNNLVRVVADTTGTYYGKAMTAGHLYTVAGGGTSLGNGRLATRAELTNPQGVTVDGDGNVVIADLGDSEIRVVAASTGTFYDQAMTAGHIYRVAVNGESGSARSGVRATATVFGLPDYVAADSAGDLFVSYTTYQRVRMIPAASGTYFGIAMTAGDAYTIAGNGTEGYDGDGEAGTAAELDRPTGVAVDPGGNLVIDDSGNDRIRVLAAASGTSYGQAMSAGDIYTIAGDGGSGYSGDGGVPTAADLDPANVALTPAGGLLIADDLGFVREVTFG